MYYSIVLCCLLATVSAQKWKCDKEAEEEVDELMSQLLTFGTSRKYPEIRKDLKPYCEENFKLIKRIEDYNRQCLDNLSKQSTSMILYSIKSLVTSYCKKNSKYAGHLLTASPCANKATKEFNKCHIGYIDALIVGRNMTDRKTRVPILCCEFHKIFDCVHTKGKKVNGCTEKILDVAEDFVKAHFERVFNLLCADFGAHSDKCDKVPRADKKKVRNITNRPKTFINPLIELLKGLTYD